MKPHILIVEDEPDIAEGIRYNLERRGEFTAQVAHDGQAALVVVLGKAVTSQGCPSSFCAHPQPDIKGSPQSVKSNVRRV